jgi:hypothetical protein
VLALATNSVPSFAAAPDSLEASFARRSTRACIRSFASVFLLADAGAPAANRSLASTSSTVLLDTPSLRHLALMSSSASAFSALSVSSAPSAFSSSPVCQLARASSGSTCSRSDVSSCRACSSWSSGSRARM